MHCVALLFITWDTFSSVPKHYITLYITSDSSKYNTIQKTGMQYKYAYINTYQDNSNTNANTIQYNTIQYNTIQNMSWIAHQQKTHVYTFDTLDQRLYYLLQELRLKEVLVQHEAKHIGLVASVMLHLQPALNSPVNRTCPKCPWNWPNIQNLHRKGGMPKGSFPSEMAMGKGPMMMGKGPMMMGKGPMPMGKGPMPMGKGPMSAGKGQSGSNFHLFVVAKRDLNFFLGLPLCRHQLARTRTWKCRLQDQALCLLAEGPMHQRSLQLCTWRGRTR